MGRKGTTPPNFSMQFLPEFFVVVVDYFVEFDAGFERFGEEYGPIHISAYSFLSEILKDVFGVFEHNVAARESVPRRP